MTTTAIDWYSMQRRAEEKLAKAEKRRKQAEYEHMQAERELERIKRDRRALEVR
jgi:hypothetical protein